jgi:prephenate dehydrogenase
MSDPDFLANSRVAILGLGLMGGSLALALHGRCRELLGCDLDQDTLILAQEMDLFSRLSPDPGEILPHAEVVVLATPLKAILKFIRKLPSLHPGSAVVFDLGSTKVQVLQALEGLPERFDPLGGHPMCGKEKTGLENAEAGLFDGATFAFTSLERTSIKAKSFAEQLARTIGARPLWIDADTHDQWSAAVSHLPYLVATALSAATPLNSGKLLGPGFRSTTRIAATPTSVMLDVLDTNREYILESLNKFRVEIDRLEGLLKNNGLEPLNNQLTQTAERHRTLVYEPSAGEIK